ncbi:MAG TPA: hypothetical protein VMM12_06755 [Longimicrobiales bacterium]|nr:hypothetical protein [Longimicrobiales bacterium]
MALALIGTIHPGVALLSVSVLSFGLAVAFGLELIGALPGTNPDEPSLLSVTTDATR